MAVYVDDMKAPYGQLIMSHMWADTYEELIAMVDTIEVQRKWLQAPPSASWVHFDIAQSKRALAIKAGALAMPMRAIVQAAKQQKLDPHWRRFYHPHEPSLT